MAGISGFGTGYGYGGAGNPTPNSRQGTLSNPTAPGAPGSLSALGQLGADSGNFSGIPNLYAYDSQGNFDPAAMAAAQKASEFNATETDTRAKTAFAENAFNDLLGQFKSGAGGAAPAGAGFVPTQLADDTDYARAKLTAAKENVGENLSSSLKALDDIMASRGISGSGIQADEMGKVIAGAGENLDNVNAGLLSDELGREQGVLTGNATGANTYNQQQVANALQARQQLVSLLGSFGIQF